MVPDQHRASRRICYPDCRRFRHVEPLSPCKPPPPVPPPFHRFAVLLVEKPTLTFLLCFCAIFFLRNSMQNFCWCDVTRAAQLRHTFHTYRRKISKLLQNDRRLHGFGYNKNKNKINTGNFIADDTASIQRKFFYVAFRSVLVRGMHIRNEVELIKSLTVYRF